MQTQRAKTRQLWSRHSSKHRLIIVTPGRIEWTEPLVRLAPVLSRNWRRLPPPAAPPMQTLPHLLPLMVAEDRKQSSTTRMMEERFVLRPLEVG